MHTPNHHTTTLSSSDSTPGHGRDADQELGVDEVLVQAARSGDTTAYGKLVARHYGVVFSVARARLRQREACEDLAQEVFLKAYLCLDHLTDADRFGAWVTRMARNLALDWMRRGAVRSRFVQLVPLQDSPQELADANQIDPKEALMRQQEREVLQDALWNLPADQRELLLLCFEEGLSQADIARRLQVHPSTVGRRIDQALALLRQSVMPVRTRTEQESTSGKLDSRAVALSIDQDIRAELAAPRKEAAQWRRRSITQMASLVGAVSSLSHEARASLVSSARESVVQLSVGGPSSQAVGTMSAKIWAGAKIGLAATATVAVLGVGSAALLGGPFAGVTSFSDFTSRLSGNPRGGIRDEDLVRVGPPIVTDDSQGEFAIPKGKLGQLVFAANPAKLKDLILIPGPDRTITMVVRNIDGSTNESIFGTQPSATAGSGQARYVQQRGGVVPQDENICFVTDVDLAFFLISTETTTGTKYFYRYKFSPNFVNDRLALLKRYQRGEIRITDYRDGTYELANKYEFFPTCPHKDLMQQRYKDLLKSALPSPNNPLDIMVSDDRPPLI